MGAALGQPSRIILALVGSSADRIHLSAAAPTGRPSAPPSPDNVHSPLPAAGKPAVRFIAGLAEEAKSFSTSSPAAWR